MNLIPFGAKEPKMNSNNKKPPERVGQTPALAPAQSVSSETLDHLERVAQTERERNALRHELQVARTMSAKLENERDVERKLRIEFGRERDYYKLSSALVWQSTTTAIDTMQRALQDAKAEADARRIAHEEEPPRGNEGAVDLDEAVDRAVAEINEAAVQPPPIGMREEIPGFLKNGPSPAEEPPPRKPRNDV